MTREELIQTVNEVKQGDNSAFEKLYNEYYDNLRYYIAKRIGNVDEAADLAQDTFVTALEKINDLRVPENFRSWLYTIATNRTNNYFRESDRIASFETDEELQSVLEQAEDYAEPLSVPSDYLENSFVQEEIRKAIDSLSPERRSALIMFYYDNMRMKDIADAMGINVNAVGHRLTEARKQISKKLKKLGSDSFALVPLPMMLSDLNKAALKTGAPAISSSAPSAAVSTVSAAKIAVTTAMAAVVGITGYGLYRMNNNDRLGDNTVDDSSIINIYEYDINNETDSLSDDSEDPYNKEKMIFDSKSKELTESLNSKAASDFEQLVRDVKVDPKNEYSYYPIAYPVMDSIFSVFDSGVLPAGGVLFYEDHYDNQPADDWYSYLLPPILIEDTDSGYDVFIVSWLDYRQNYPESNYKDKSYIETKDINGEKTVYYDKPSPSLVVGFTGDENDLLLSERSNTVYECCWRKWERPDGADVRQCIAFFAVDGGVASKLSLVTGIGFLDADNAITKTSLVLEDIPISEDLDLIRYTASNPTSTVKTSEDDEHITDRDYVWDNIE